MSGCHPRHVNKYSSSLFPPNDDQMRCVSKLRHFRDIVSSICGRMSNGKIFRYLPMRSHDYSSILYLSKLLVRTVIIFAFRCLPPLSAHLRSFNLRLPVAAFGWLASSYRYCSFTPSCFAHSDHHHRPPWQLKAPLLSSKRTCPCLVDHRSRCWPSLIFCPPPGQNPLQPQRTTETVRNQNRKWRIGIAPYKASANPGSWSDFKSGTSSLNQ